jgi:rhodanese-related sulfurtransferase
MSRGVIRGINAQVRLSLQETKTLALALLSPNPPPATLLVDVRTDAEVAEGMIPAATHVALDMLPQALADGGRLGALPRDHRLVMYCRAGVRSETAVKLAHDAGFTTVDSFDGGWSKYARDPIEPTDE